MNTWVITGGRNYVPTFEELEQFKQFVEKNKIDTIVHGGAHGVDDFIGSRATQMFGLRSITFLAEWKKHGRAAGPIRNKKMLENKEYPVSGVIAFKGGAGTSNCIMQAKKLNLLVFLISGNSTVAL